MVVIPFFIVTKFSFLHFGQKRGKFTSSVSLRILVRVLLLQTGQSTHICCSAIKNHLPYEMAEKGIARVLLIKRYHILRLET